MASGVLAVAALTAGAAYVDAKLHVSKDLNQLLRLKKAETNFAQAVKAKKASGFFLFEAAAKKYQDAPCIWSRQAQYTWSEAYKHVCQYGHYFRDLGVKPSQHVVVYMYNSPELLFIWMGLLSIGAAPALVNYALASDALVHCVRLARAKFLIFDAAPDLAARIQAVDEQLRSLGVEPMELSVDLRNNIDSNPAHPAEVSCFQENRETLPFALMYTSGTTGLPKAFPLTVARNYGSASLFPKTFGQQPGPGADRTYYCIPLYHGTGGIAAMNDLMGGISIAIAPKFSLRQFWTDCIASGSTIFVYVGELVRYLLSAPASPKDRQHRIRLVWGNGLSPELWGKFKERFGVSDIGEFYASTEGILTLVNHCRNDFGVGAVGHHGWLFRRKFHDTYVPAYIDPETGNVWRSPETGFAKRQSYDEGGEILARLPSRSAWAGYWHASEATDKKLMENVFEMGDLYFRTGDSLRRDANGHWYFLDRLGDTYRWKGENVSTTEVAQVMGSDVEIAEANVYGVKIPSHNGKAGCAAVAFKTATAENFDWTGLASSLRASLPSYAVPIFIRVRRSVGGMSTGNHKHNKVPLREEGVDPELLGTKVGDGKNDPIYWLPADSPKYVPLTRRDWQVLCQAQARL